MMALNISHNKILTNIRLVYTYSIQRYNGEGILLLITLNLWGKPVSALSVGWVNLGLKLWIALKQSVESLC